MGLQLRRTLLYKVGMRWSKYALASMEVILIFPAALFMTALFGRNVQPLQYEPAHTAQRIVMWYAARRLLGLWVLLIALPLMVLVTGGATLLRRWSDDVELQQASRAVVAAVRRHLGTAMIAGSTLAAGGVLAIVALHVLTD